MAVAELRDRRDETLIFHILDPETWIFHISDPETWIFHILSPTDRALAQISVGRESGDTDGPSDFAQPCLMGSVRPEGECLRHSRPSTLAPFVTVFVCFPSFHARWSLNKNTNAVPGSLRPLVAPQSSFGNPVPLVRCEYCLPLSFLHRARHSRPAVPCAHPTDEQSPAPQRGAQASSSAGSGAAGATGAAGGGHSAG